MKRRALTTDQQAQLRTWFLDEKLSLRGAAVRAEGLKWDISRTTLDTYRREILGAASQNAPAQVLQAAQAAAAEGPGGGLEGPAAPPDGHDLGEDDLVQINQQLRRVLHLGLTTQDPTVAEKSLRTAMSVTRQLDQLRLARNPGRAPAALLYLPVELPDPDIYDPNDPASWPDNPFLRAPYTPDPERYPPDNLAAWPDNPYGCAGRPS